MEVCEICLDDEDVWFEAERLYPQDQANAIGAGSKSVRAV